MDGQSDFVSDAHTVRYLRAGELYVSRLAERRSWNEWVDSGREGLVERVQNKVGKILAEHEVEPLSEVQESELDKILHAAQAELA
jgi:trimethylamine:corrinoid methyltransferase-like protein